MVSDIDRRKGLSATAAAEVFWGLTPIYWKAVATVSTHELLALRVLWAIPFAVVLLTLRDAWGDVWRAVSSWHTLSALLLTAALIGCNWFAFLIAMENGQILQSSLGYFITPLVSILLGFVFLGERLHAVQWVAVAALVHDSKLTVTDPNPEASHRPILYDSGRPSSGIWFRTVHATTDSATRPPRDRARSRSPRIDVYRKNAFSTRAWSW